MNNPLATYQTLRKSLREIALLGSVGSLLEWDQRTQMPPKGAEFRAEQLSLIARSTHEQFTADRIGDLLAELGASGLAADPHGDVGTDVRETRRSYDRARRLPASLVEEMSRTSALAQQAWAEARKKSEYAIFEPWLAKTLDLKRQQAMCYLAGAPADSDSLYDALLDDFEPHAKTAELRGVFEQLRKDLVELVGRIASSGKIAPVEILERRFPATAQEQLARDAARLVGFDFEAGRLDVSLHPFCSGLVPGDTRMTTRYDEHGFADAFFGVLHETGHALYDQGLPKEHWGAPTGSAVSLGIHESQSRMWENLVGRSAAFWKFQLPKARAAFPEALTGVSEDQWLWAINNVRPSLIRVESDEITYNLHILVRFELEQAMLSGQLAPKDLPGEWNARMKQYLGIDVPNNAQGCLQDIHWSDGAIGYFPTYTLGNLYAAQFFAKANTDVAGLEAQIAAGEFAGLLSWLRENIHRHGKRYSAGELVRRATGRPLSAEPLMQHLRAKAARYYGV